MCRRAVSPDWTRSVITDLFCIDLFWFCLLIFLRRLKIAELLTSDIESGNGEAEVLIQSIISIKSIIKQDPSCHEKVSSLLLYLLSCCYTFPVGSFVLIIPES